MGIPRARLGAVAVLAVGLFAWTWLTWGTIELYYEGWWGPWWQRAFYLVPGLLFLLLAVVAALRPRAGGVILLAVGGAFSAFVIAVQLGRGANLNLRFVLGWFPVTVVVVAPAGAAAR